MVSDEEAHEARAGEGGRALVPQHGKVPERDEAVQPGLGDGDQAAGESAGTQAGHLFTVEARGQSARQVLPFQLPGQHHHIAHLSLSSTLRPILFRGVIPRKEQQHEPSKHKTFV